MSGRGTNIDLLFRNGLESYEQLPPAEVWDSISGTLPQRRSAGWLSAAAAAAIILLLGASFWLVSPLLRFEMEPGMVTLNQDIVPDGVPVAPTPVFSDEIIGRVGEEPYFTAVSLHVMNGYERPIDVAVEEAALQTAFTSFDLYHDTPGDLRLMPGYQTGIPVYSPPPASADMLPLPSAERAAGRFGLSASMSPSLYVRSSGSANQAMASLLNSESPMISFSSGMSLSYNINSRLSFSAGLYYSQVGQAVENVTAFTGFSSFLSGKGSNDIIVTTSAGRIVTTNPDLFIADHMGKRVSTVYDASLFDPVKFNLRNEGNRLVQNMGYLEVPLLVRYKFVDSGIDLSLLGGLSYSFLVNNSVYAASRDGGRIEAGYTEGLSPFNISTTMGLGVGYSLPNSFAFNVEPMVRYYINSLGEHPGPSINAWSVGVMTGVRYSF